MEYDFRKFEAKRQLKSAEDVKCRVEEDAVKVMHKFFGIPVQVAIYFAQVVPRAFSTNGNDAVFHFGRIIQIPTLKRAAPASV